MNFADQGHLGDKIDLVIGMDYYWTFMAGKVQQLHGFHNLVMLGSVFGCILSGSLNADGTENRVINTNVTHGLRIFATGKYNYENELYNFGT